MEDEGGTVFEKDERTGKDEIFTKVVRAGKRTYFFDVKATRSEDYYLTITESKKRLGKEGKVFYEKHKIFLYKEDFEKFADGLREAVDYIGSEKVQDQASDPEVRAAKPPRGEAAAEKKEMVAGEFTNVDFDDLGRE